VIGDPRQGAARYDGSGGPSIAEENHEVSLEEQKRRERAQAMGLFCSQLICPARDEGLSSKQRGKLVREIAAATHTDPFGNQIQVSRETLDRWIRRYRAGGFEALVPAPRRLAARTDAQVLELAASLNRENLTRTVAQVARILRTATGWAPSESTLLRHFHRLELMGPDAGEVPAVFGRFEAADPNELWVGDALHGPRVGDRKTYLFAFLDDHSRLAVGYRFGFAEDTVRLAAGVAPGAGCTRCSRRDLRRQRQRLRRRVAATCMRQTRCAPGSFPTRPASRTGQDRTLVS
jgi:putative transposase